MNSSFSSCHSYFLSSFFSFSLASLYATWCGFCWPNWTWWVTALINFCCFAPFLFFRPKALSPIIFFFYSTFLLPPAWAGFLVGGQGALWRQLTPARLQHSCIPSEDLDPWQEEEDEHATTLVAKPYLDFFLFIR